MSLPTMLSRCALLALLSLPALVSSFVPASSRNSLSATNVVSSRTTSLASLPGLIVLDLDNTVWTPELYQLRKIARNNGTPKAGLDVELFPGTKEVFETIRSSRESGGEWSNVRLAVASRTKSVDWAHNLLDQFGIRDLFHYVEIFPGDKQKHFANLQTASDIPYDKMLFFDDARDGRYGNCVPVSQLGVLAAHTPGGIDTETVFHTAIQAFKEWDGQAGTIIEHDGTVTKLPAEEDEGPASNERVTGKVVKFFEDRGFGFIQYGKRGTKDVFVHVRNLKGDVDFLEVGDELTFKVGTDRKTGKKMAMDVEKAGSSSSSGSDEIVDTANLRVFSMNQPFAALLANGHKTLETRNGTMFISYPEGTKFLLHVGRRTYPDGDRHIEVMKSGGLSDAEIEDLKSLPNGFGRGMAVAILEIGKTFDTTLEERCDPDFQRKVCAFGEDSGRRATEIRRVQCLKRPVKVGGQGGVFKADIPRDAIPDGWLPVAPEGVNESGGTISRNTGSRVVYSITG